MAELPEISKYSKQMNKELSGKRISGVTLLQEKNLNVPSKEFSERCVGAGITGVSYKGKWFVIPLDNKENILFSLGMGGDVFYFEITPKEEKYHVRVDLSDGTGFTIRYWWFGKFLIVSDAELPNEPNTKNIAMDPFDRRFTYEYFRGLFKGQKSQIKAFIIDQKNIGGIGNMYMHDILFTAGIHPKMKISDMAEEDFERLYRSIVDMLRFSEENGTFSYEKDFYGVPGGLTMDDFIIGYKEGKPCPKCGTAIVMMKTGSTAAYICPICQKN
jgi:formamidopyrimidine-DNA glycosylase